MILNCEEISIDIPVNGCIVGSLLILSIDLTPILVYLLN
jgi:hypothetical protein